MEEVPLTNSDMVATVDDADYALVSGRTWFLVEPAKNCFYARAHSHVENGHQKFTHMHNLIMDALWIDHIDGNGLNNTRTNLRVATNAQNQANSRKRQGTHSKYKGVSWNKNINRWQAYVNKDGVRHYCGCHTNEEAAARARDAKAYELFGEYARLNFPREGGE